MLFQETISYNLSKGESVYVAFMDIRKAFDTAYIPGLLYKLYNLELSMKTFKLISDSYQNYECAALVAGCPGSWFKPQRGIHQGGPLSMPLYQFFINYLLNQLRSDPHGAGIANIDVTCPTSADDIAVCALHKQWLIDRCKLHTDIVPNGSLSSAHRNQ